MSDNPFKDLGKKLFPPKPAPSPQGVPGALPHAKAAPHPQKKKHKENPSLSDEEALFLDAVGSIKPARPKKSAKTEEPHSFTPFAEAFGQTNKAAPPEGKKTPPLQNSRLPPSISPLRP